MIEKTQLKFVKSEKTNELIGFVSKTKDNKLKGVREDSVYGKRICILAEELKGSILPNTLYEVELKPMHRGKNGYVVTSAVQVLSEVTIESFIVPKKEYRVVINFGGKKNYKTIYFDPLKGKTFSSRTKEGVLEILHKRNDIAHPEGVIADFIGRADELVRQMREDGYDIR
ncbi:hypothetical protein [Bacteroides sp.]|uniref:hypothetical protein n=1 Tax=Bacteroides sp. TaxID=29523 RepID=UPI003A95A2CC